MESKELKELKKIEQILKCSEEIINNPFSSFPKESVEEALEIIESHTEEIP